MRSQRKKPSADLRNYYTIFLQMATIMVLIICIGAVKMNFRTNYQKTDLVEEQEVVEMKEVIQTKQKKVPPPPPRPQVPIEVPNDQIIDQQEINLNADLNLDKPLEMPPPPKQEKQKEEKFFIAVQQMPKLKGGQEWLYDHVKYPERARRAGIEGRVIIQFIVTKNGKVENPRILRGIGGGCDEAALNVIKEATFSPGRQRGRAVRVQMAQTIVFRLQN